MSFSEIKINTILQTKENLRAGFTGLMKQSDGVWHCLINASARNTYTGLVKHSTRTWYYVKSGKCRAAIQGLA